MSLIRDNAGAVHPGAVHIVTTSSDSHNRTDVRPDTR